MEVPTFAAEAVRRIRVRYDQFSSTAFAATFFRHLVVAMPEVRGLLPANLDRHGEYLEAAVAVVIRNLADLEVLNRPLEELGAEHARRGIDAGQLIGVHPVLMATVRDLSGERWTMDDERDWAVAFSALLAPMVRGAAKESLNVEGRRSKNAAL